MSNIFILARKFLLKIAQDPKAEKLLKKHLGPAKQFENPIFKEMISRGIVPIVSAREVSPNFQNKEKKWEHSALLGTGAYNKVYEVSYKGHRAVAKVTSSVKDYVAMFKLSELKKKMGKEGKHLATVYDAFKSKTGYYVTVVEILEPINSHLRKVLFETYDDGPQSAFLEGKAQQDYLEIIETMHEFLKNRHRMILQSMDKNIQSLLWEKLDSAFKKAFDESKTPGEFRSKFKAQRKLIHDQLYQLIMSRPTNTVEPMKSQDEIKRSHDYANITDILYDALYGIEEKMPLEITFPYAYESQNNSEIKHLLQKPETKNFLEFLYKLKKNFGIEWQDLHGANIMLRPYTHDLVISDPGLFYFND